MLRIPDVSSNFYVVLTVAIGMGAVVFLFTTQPTIAPAFTAVILPFLVGIVGSIQQSKHNTAKLEENTDLTAKTYKTVDGRMTEFKKLMVEYARQQAELVGEVQKAKGIVIGQNTPVADQDVSLAIDPVLKQGGKPILGDHQ